MAELLLEEISKSIVSSPYPTIIKWSESILKLVGAKTYPILSLMPISLFSPKIPLENDEIMANISTLILAPSGSGKSTLISKLFGGSCFNCLEMNRQSAPKFIERLYETSNASIVCPDIDIIFKDPILMKVLEGICGEEQRVNSSNMARERIFKMNAVFLGGGLPNSLTRYATFGMLRRLFPLVMFHTTDERDDIYDKITQSAFKSNSKIVTTQTIKDYYSKIINIQLGHDDEFKKITGYVVKDDYVWGIREMHKKLSEHLPNDKYLMTELHAGFRFLVNSAMLNFFNRKKEMNGEENNIVIEEQDFEVAKQLMYMEMKMKSYIYNCFDEMMSDSNISRLYDKVNNVEDNIYRGIAKIFLQERVNRKIVPTQNQKN